MTLNEIAEYAHVSIGTVDRVIHNRKGVSEKTKKLIQSIIEEYGYGDKFIHSTGHSLGLDIHETPGFSFRDDTIIEKGMVITVEPGIYLEGEFGVRIEDTVAVENKGKIIGNLPLI